MKRGPKKGFKRTGKLTYSAKGNTVVSQSTIAKCVTPLVAKQLVKYLNKSKQK